MTAPADGKRRALAGYIPQYLIAAQLIYNHIKRGSLDWVSLVDPTAGRVDDVIIGSPGRVDAYQVKWARLKRSYTFQGLIKPEDDRPSLWRQLADGWRALQASSPDRSVFVHLVSNEMASANSVLPPDDSSPGTFQELWADVFARHSQGTEIPRKYDEALKALATESGLSAADFATFVSRCMLDLDFQDPQQVDRTNLLLLSELDDVQALAAHLKSRVSQADGAVHLSQTDLLTDLGWAKRLAPYFRHDFVLDVASYKAIEPTTSEIRALVARRAFGYAALLGGPGSGKSTTLTHTLKYEKGIRPITYYAYLRGDSALGRGEAASFWHDMYVALRAQGFHLYEAIPRTGEDFRHAVSQQFQKLSEEWRRTGTVTVILIDGLDHIDREQHPTESLIRQLPLPDQLPAGIIVFLGTQTLALDGLAPSIRAHLTADRELTMARLARADIVTLAKAILPPTTPATTGDYQLIFERGEGHPLATMYLLVELSSASTADAVRQILDASRSYSGDIERRYEAYWRAIKSDATKNLLALVCRIRVPLDILTALTWTPGMDGTAFLRESRHYFLALSANRWIFFHNSFRQFLLRRTAVNLLDQVDPAIGRSYHQTLAGICERSSDATLRHEALFHYSSAGDDARVISIGRQTYFRDQYFSLRSTHKIYDDISIVVRAAAELNDGLAFARCWLIENELREREQALSQASFRANLDVFMSESYLLDAVCDGHQLFVTPTDALRVASRLHRIGRLSESFKVFELAEPLEYLTSIAPLDLRPNGTRDLLNAWLDVAVEFRSPTTLLEAIARLVTNETERDSGASSERLRFALQVHLGALCASRGREIYDQFLAGPGLTQDGLAEAIDWRVAGQATHPEIRISAIRRLASAGDMSTWPEEDRVYLADLKRRHDFPREDIEALIRDLKQPPLLEDQEPDRYTGHSIDDFAHRILLCRLLAFLGKPAKAEVAVPWPTGAEKQRVARFERSLVAIANLWGEGLRGHVSSPAAMELSLAHVMRTFDRVGKEDPGSGWYRYEAVREDFFGLVVKAVASHGNECVEHLGRMFDALWAESDPRCHWSSGLRRTIAIALIGSGADRAASLERIGKLQGDLEEQDLDERLEACIEQARAWRLLGEQPEAASLLVRLLGMSFGIYHRKDRQFQSWVEWLDNAIQFGGTTLDQEIGSFVAATEVLESTGRGRGTQDALAHLLSISIREDLPLGMAIADRVLRNGTAGYGFYSAGLVSGLQSREDCDFDALLPYLSSLAVALELPSSEKIAAAFAKGFCAKGHSPAQLEPLVKGILVDEFEGARRAWFSGLADGAKVAGADNRRFADLVEERALKRDTTPQEIALLDGTKVTDHQLEEEIRDYASLTVALDRVQPDTSYSWREVAEPIIASLSVADLTALQEKFRKFKSKHASVAAALAERYVQLGEIARAEEIVSGELDGSRTQGWIRWYDGGTRLRPALVLVKIDAAKYRAKLLKQLAEDYLTEIRNPGDFVMSLDEMLPLLFETIPWAQLWAEIREHIHQLAEFRHAPPDIQPVAILDTKHALLISVQNLYRFPIPELEYRCARVIATWLSDPEGAKWLLPHLSSAITSHTLPTWKGNVPEHVERMN